MKIRIIARRGGGYLVQIKKRWFPFWMNVTTDSCDEFPCFIFSTLENAKSKAMDIMKYENSVDRVVYTIG